LDKPAGGPPVERKVFDFKGPGVAIGMHNRDEFKKRNLTYEHQLIDDMIALALKWNGGFGPGGEEL
jgi:hypothetical protein